MNELDLFLTHLFCNIENVDITLTKRMKYGYRHYYLNVNIEKEGEDNLNKSSSFGTTYLSNLTHITDFSIVIDNRNRCIDIFSNMDSIVVENQELVDKWTEVFEKYIQDSLEKNVE